MSTIEASARPDRRSFSESVDADGARIRSRSPCSASIPSRVVAKTPAWTAFGWKSSARVIWSGASDPSSPPHPAEQETDGEHAK